MGRKARGRMFIVRGTFLISGYLNQVLLKMIATLGTRCRRGKKPQDWKEGGTFTRCVASCPSGEVIRSEVWLAWKLLFLPLDPGKEVSKGEGRAMLEALSK